MQPFLPFADMYWSAHTLDSKRLNKQIDEPEGYYWPVAKRGGKAWADYQRWLEWGRKHELI